jgi:hypothetical protein
LMEKTLGNQTFVRPRRRWQGNIEMDLMKRYKHWNWLELVNDRLHTNDVESPSSATIWGGNEETR